MHDDATGQAHTAHTLNLVPCVYVGRPATLIAGGALQDIAPDAARDDGTAEAGRNDRPFAGPLSNAVAART